MRDEIVTSSKINLTTTQKTESSESTTNAGLVTWTLGLGNDVTDNVTKGTIFNFNEYMNFKFIVYKNKFKMSKVVKHCSHFNHITTINS